METPRPGQVRYILFRSYRPNRATRAGMTHLFTQLPWKHEECVYVYYTFVVVPVVIVEIRIMCVCACVYVYYAVILLPVTLYVITVETWRICLWILYFHGGARSYCGNPNNMPVCILDFSISARLIFSYLSCTTQLFVAFICYLRIREFEFCVVLSPAVRWWSVELQLRSVRGLTFLKYM